MIIVFPSNQVGYVSKLSFFLNHVSNFTEINSTLLLGPTFGLWIPDFNPFFVNDDANDPFLSNFETEIFLSKTNCFNYEHGNGT